MKLKYLHILIILLLFHNLLDAQNLKRKGLLGIMMQTLNDSIAAGNDLKVNDGVYITSVAPNSTFYNLGVKQGDVLTKLNGTSVNAIQDVLAITTSLYENDRVDAEYYANNVKKNGSAVLLGRPFETFRNGNVTYGQVVYKNNVLRSILVTPKHKKTAAVVYFLQGYTCGTVETMSDEYPMKRLMNDWLDAGFAVYRIEKPGVGDSNSKKHCMQIGFEEELQAFKEGYKDLLQQTSIDSNNIFMFGHSMGGVIAPLLNEVKSPRGIITYGSVGKNWYDYMVDLYTIQPKHFGTSDAQIKEDNKVNLKFNDDLLLHKLSGAELIKNKVYAEFFNAEALKNEQYIGRHIKFWQNLADVNISKAWSKVQTNVLALYGEFDIQAINAEGSQKIAAIVNENGGNGDFMLIEKADHGFVNFNSMQHNVATLGNGSYLNHSINNYSTGLGKTTVNWMISKLNN